jgi:hypothetical protein
LWALSEAWELCRAEIIKECLGKKATKKQKALVPKLTAIGDEIKNAILKLFLTRSKIRH